MGQYRMSIKQNNASQYHASSDNINHLGLYVYIQGVQKKTQLQ